MSWINFTSMIYSNKGVCVTVSSEVYNFRLRMFTVHNSMVVEPFSQQKNILATIGHQVTWPNYQLKYNKHYFLALYKPTTQKEGCYEFDVDICLSACVCVCVSLRHRSSQRNGPISMPFFS